MHSLRREEREPGELGSRSAGEIETELATEDTTRTRSRSVAFVDAMIEDVLK
jgi:hypothetical protein